MVQRTLFPEKEILTFSKREILTFSDIRIWKGYEELVDRVQPDVIVLAGDLTFDGFAPFYWSLGVHDSLGDKYKNNKNPLENRRRIHVDRFYQFLRYAGKKSKVLVVKGNHDEEFEGSYVPDKINEIQGCREISGRFIEINNLRFLGLGFNETYSLRILKPLIVKYKEKVDIVIMHGLRVPLISSLRPKLIIRGGIGPGKYLINDVPSVFTDNVEYTIIEVENGKLPKILQYRIGLDDKPELVNSDIKLLFKRYKWIKPYPSEISANISD